MPAYYNEHDPFAAAWLRELIVDGLIAPGEVDERDIQDVLPSDLDGYDQCHFFAGIGGWSYSLRLAGWPDDRPVWTGSCPCQPFSAAGRGAGVADERHLWPHFHHLIAERRPAVVFGEQVASKAGRAWLASVRADLEGVAYRVGAADLCAAGVGAPHIRQRLWWVADADQGQRGWIADGQGRERNRAEAGRHQGDGKPPSGCDAGRLADAKGQRRDRGEDTAETHWRHGTEGASRNPWANLVWLPCRDGKARPTQPGIFPLAHGVPNRVGTLRGAGNAIVPEAAAEFIRAYEEACLFL